MVRFFFTRFFGIQKEQEGKKKYVSVEPRSADLKRIACLRVFDLKCKNIVEILRGNLLEN